MVTMVWANITITNITIIFTIFLTLKVLYPIIENFILKKISHVLYNSPINLFYVIFHCSVYILFRFVLIIRSQVLMASDNSLFFT